MAAVLYCIGNPTPYSPSIPALAVGPIHDVGLVLHSGHGQNYLKLHKDDSGEAQPSVCASLSLSGGRQEKFSERGDEAVVRFLIICQSCVTRSDDHSHVSVCFLSCVCF